MSNETDSAATNNQRGAGSRRIEEGLRTSGTF
jgi:hypothetical protein